MTSTTLSPPTAPPAHDVEPVGPATTRDATRRSWVQSWWRGRPEDPAWVRPALFALLALTAALYLWDLGASGWANTYYSAAVQAGTKSWKAFLFGSTDASNFITVDKTPASLWPMEISARIFGLSSWSVLVPQALEGVAAVGLLYAAVRRWFSPAAALLAGATMALTPVAALMFRFNNPDALLVLLMTAGASTMTRAVQDGRTRWLVATGVLMGFAFLAKELQAFLVLPAFGLVYLVAGPPKLLRRFLQLVALGIAMLLSFGWWIAVVELTPASSRPYIGGSQNNSFWNVLFGYNGFGRLTGNESGSVGGGAAGQTGRWGPTGWTRLFNPQFGGQVSWLLPAALILLVAGLAVTWRRPRTDRLRASLILWGGWLFVTGAAISLAKGIIHPYYTVALAPAIGAVVGIGALTFWSARRHWLARAVLGASIIATAFWARALLDRTPTWNPWLRIVVVLGGLAAGILVCIPTGARRQVSLAAGLAGAAIALAAPAAYSIATASTAYGGAIPSAGPAVVGAGFGPGGGPGGVGGPVAGGPPGGAAGGGFTRPGAGAPAGGFNPGQGGTFPGGANAGGFRGPGAGPGAGLGGAAAGGRGGLGGLLNGTNVGSELTALLRQGSDGFRWTAAAVGANTAGSHQLASGEPIMAIGGFNGTDPAPSLAEFQAYVRAGKIHYYIDSGGGIGGAGAGGGSASSAEIAAWVRASFTAQTVSGVTIYDLTQPSI